MKIQEVYPIIKKLIFEKKQSAYIDPKLGNFSFTPQGHNVYDHHRFVFSKKNQMPTQADYGVLLEALHLSLRQFTRETGYVLIMEISFDQKQVGDYGCFYFFWKTPNTAGLLNLNTQESNISTWWLNIVQTKKDEDKKTLSGLGQMPGKPHWTQSSLLH